MKQDNMPQVARFWNDIANEFDSIYTGENKSAIGRTMDRVFRKDMYERFEWVMRKSGDVRGLRICDVGCGSGRFVTELARRGASHVTGVDVAPDMLKLARNLVETNGVANQCDFVLSDVLNWKTDQKYDISIAIGFWDDPASAEGTTQWVRGAFKAIEPFTDGYYVNHGGYDESERRVRAAYGDNFPRLAAIKKRYDPGNLFRLNANIKPA